MPGDYSRLTFDPLKDRALLLEQQGRVQFDGDVNEQRFLLLRRLQVETRDIVGPAVYPAIEPESFKLKGAPSGPWTIGRGRMYVDGLLAENHGVGALGYEPVWDEPQGTKDTPIDEQPYAGTQHPPAIDTHALAFLDVWQHEQTYVEDPSMLEPALGVDTATRVQTAWQVRTLKLDDEKLDCGSDWDKVGAWQEVIRRSDARLSSAATKPPDPADPCAVAPVGGYRGLENRLYRGQIHDGGAPGAATFKWSRDNGAVAARITALTGAATQPIITVERLGRDEIQRFLVGQWVECTDDEKEFNRTPGLMGQVLETDQTQSTVTLAAPLTGTLDLARNPRMRRWDQKTGVDANGVIPITTSPQTIDLEDGIQVTIRIDGAGARALVGDWWVFAARAASASIEELDEVPPRGIRHHFARLAVIHDGKVVDCRVPWPGACECEGSECGCTRCVTPESHKDDGGILTIQAAIDAASAKGGRVCLAPGRYRLKRPLRISGANGLTLAGEGLATVIEAPPQLGIVVEDSFDVSLERFALVAARGDALPGIGIALLNTAGCRVERCFVVQSLTSGTTGIGLAGFALRTRVVENVIIAGTAVGDIVFGEQVSVDRMPASFLPFAGATHGTDKAAAAAKKALGRATSYLITIDLAIEDNLLLGALFGVRFGDTALTRAAVLAALTIHAAATRIARNLIFGGESAGIALTGLALERGATKRTAIEIEDLAKLASSALSRVAHVDVRENLLVVTGDGIRATVDELTIAGNTVQGSGTADLTTGTGVRLGGSSAARAGAIARIAGNTIADQPAHGVYAKGGDGTVEVVGNRITRTGLGAIAIQGSLEASDARVVDNVLVGIGLRVDPDRRLSPRGIDILGATDALVSNNVLREFAHARGASGVGIELKSCDVIHIDGNQLVDLGGNVAGVVVGGTDAIDMRGNTIRIAVIGDQQNSIALDIVTLGDSGKPVRDTSELVGDPGARAVAEGIMWGSFVAAAPAASVATGLPQVAVHGNTLHAAGDGPVVHVTGECKLTFSENRCRWLARRRLRPAVLLGVPGAAIVSANHVESPDSDNTPVMYIGVSTSGVPSATVLGNITHGSIALNGNALPAPWAALNVTL